MSNDTGTDKGEQITPASNAYEPFSDWFLQDLVEIANNGESSDFLGVTLNIGGFLVSGMLIGGKEYFTSLAEELVTNVSDDDKEAADGVYRFFSEYGEAYQPRKEGEEPDSSHVRFIHLKNAKFFHPGGNPIPANQGTLWRGQLHAVHGFFIGTIGKVDS